MPRTRCLLHAAPEGFLCFVYGKESSCHGTPAMYPTDIDLRGTPECVSIGRVSTASNRSSSSQANCKTEGFRVILSGTQAAPSTNDFRVHEQGVVPLTILGYQEANSVERKSRATELFHFAVDFVEYISFLHHISPLTALV